MVLDTSASRLNRAENDIETLRTTQTNILDHLDSYSKTLNETRDIAAENRERLGRLEEIALETHNIARQNHERLGSIEDRQKRMEDRPADSWKASMDRTIATMDRITQIARENGAMLRENRAIALAIAEHLGVPIEKRDSSVHSG